MKKTYIIPELTVVATELKTAILEPSVGIGNGCVDAGNVEVTGERGGSRGSSSSDYNVWNEDWQKP